MKRRALGFLSASLWLGMGPWARAADKGTADEAVALVKKAVAYLKANGKEKAYAEISNTAGQFVSKDLYLFVYGLTDGLNYAHGANPKMVGKNLMELKDGNGVFIVKEFIKTANGKTGTGWIDYQWPNPITKAMESKSTYVEKVGDVLIGCGIYK
ncbi:MAG: cache domain-containing protein [Pseudomonadota bacterium]